MARYGILSTTVTVLICCCAAALASPIETAKKCEDVSKFDTAWFLANERSAFRKPLANTALFYTRGMTASAIAYAESSNLITIWDIWDDWLYQACDVPTNPMRCIHNNETLRTTFYENMARAFARKVDGSAVVMHSEEDYKEPPLNGIWGRVELQVLKRKDSVGSIAKIRKDGSMHSVFWPEPLPGGMAWYRKQEKLSLKTRRARVDRRDLGSQSCKTQKANYEFFDSIA